MTTCPANEQQLLYIEERMNDILNLNEDLALPSGITIHDVFRFFKGDVPARQFKAGHQKGVRFESTKFTCQLRAVINLRRTVQSFMKI